MCVQGQMLHKLQGYYGQTLIKGALWNWNSNVANIFSLQWNLQKRAGMLKELCLIGDKRLFIDFDVREIKLLIDLISTG